MLEIFTNQSWDCVTEKWHSTVMKYHELIDRRKVLILTTMKLKSSHKIKLETSMVFIYIHIELAPLVWTLIHFSCILRSKVTINIDKIRSYSIFSSPFRAKNCVMRISILVNIEKWLLVKIKAMQFGDLVLMYRFLLWMYVRNWISAM